MKKSQFYKSCVAGLLIIGSAAVADDVRIDEALRLVESGVIKHFNELNDIALAVQPGSIKDTELETEYGRYIYKVEIRDAMGVEWDVEVDAISGDILKRSKDD